MPKHYPIALFEGAPGLSIRHDACCQEGFGFWRNRASSTEAFLSRHVSASMARTVSEASDPSARVGNPYFVMSLALSSGALGLRAIIQELKRGRHRSDNSTCGSRHPSHIGRVGTRTVAIRAGAIRASDN